MCECVSLHSRYACKPKMLNIVPWTVQQQMRTPHKELVLFCALLQFLPSAAAAMAGKQTTQFDSRLFQTIDSKNEKQIWWIDKRSTSTKVAVLPNCSNLIVVGADINAIAAHTHSAHLLCSSGRRAKRIVSGHMNGVTLPNLLDGQYDRETSIHIQIVAVGRCGCFMCKMWSKLHKYDLTRLDLTWLVNANRANDVWHVLNFGTKISSPTFFYRKSLNWISLLFVCVYTISFWKVFWRSPFQ